LRVRRGVGELVPLAIDLLDLIPISCRQLVWRPGAPDLLFPAREVPDLTVELIRRWMKRVYANSHERGQHQGQEELEKIVRRVPPRSISSMAILLAFG
jgi:hypothetical protein